MPQKRVTALTERRQFELSAVWLGMGKGKKLGAVLSSGRSQAMKELEVNSTIALT